MGTANLSGAVSIRFSNFAVPNADQCTGTWARSVMERETQRKYDLPLQQFLDHDDPAARLPGTATGEDFGIVGATFGTNAITLETIDEKANAGEHAVYGRTTFRLPPEYEAGQVVQIAVAAGAGTTAADTSMVVDVEAHKVHATNGSAGADLVTTAAQDCNNTTAAIKVFSLDASGLEPGDKLEIRVSITTEDAATATVVKGIINNAYVQCTIRG